MKITLVLLLFPILGLSQIEWEQNFGGTAIEDGEKIIAGQDDQVLLIGFTNSSDEDISNNYGQNDAWACLIDQAGNLIWQKTLGGSSNDRFFDGVQHPVDGWLLVGQSSSDDGDLNDDTDSSQGLLCHLSSNGTVQWCKTFGLDEDDEFNSISQRTNGNFLISGATDNEDLFFKENERHSNQDFWLLEVDEEGNLIWERKYGGSDWEQALCHAEDEDGHIYLSGFTYSLDGDISQSFGLEDIWIVKTNSEGELIWEKSFGGTKQDQARSILIHESSIYVVGRSISNDGTFDGYGLGQEDAFILKIDKQTGDLEALKNFGGALGDRFNQILLYEEKLILAGYTRSPQAGLEPKGMADFWLLRLKPEDLSLIWMKSYGGDNEDIAKSLYLSNDQSTILLGSSYSSDQDVSQNQGLADLWVLKTDILNAQDISPLATNKDIIYRLEDNNIYLSNLPDSPLLYRLYDLNGRVIKEENFKTVNGEKSIRLANGAIFFLTIVDTNTGEQIFVLKTGGI